MPKIVIPNKQLEPPARVPAGIVEVRMDGFKPALSKAKPGKTQTINLNPQLRVINHSDPEFNNKPVMENLNVGAGWVIRDFVHAFGLELVRNGDSSDIPGEFPGGVDNNPATWAPYQGPLLGRTGTVELIETEYDNKKQTKIKRYFCHVQGCQEAHSENLVKN